MAEPIVTVAEMRARENRTWAVGVAPEAVIHRAGKAVGEVARRWTRPGDPVLVLAGRGHNGDDAMVASGLLDDRERMALRLPDPRALELAHAWLRAHRADPRALVVDGLFGIGLNRPLEGDWAALVAAVNGAQVRVLAVDVPSGLDADTGRVFGVAIEAAVTVTLGSVKVGLLVEEAARYVGRLELAPEIGLVPIETDVELQWTLSSDFVPLLRRRPVTAHKGTFGHVAILAGSLGFHGAAVLAAQGAQRARPGLVTVFTDERCLVPVASQLRAAMVRPWKGERLGDTTFTAIVAGPGLASCGLSPAIRAEVERLWREAPCPMVVDASALDWLASGGECAGGRVITPHPGEAGRMLGASAAAVQADRLSAVRRLAGRWPLVDPVVVLKGRHSLVGRRRGPCFVNSSGNPGLAQGGSGDVLAGLLGGLLAQPALQEEAMLAVRYGVWRHGAAADALEEAGGAWTTEDLVPALGRRVVED